MRIVSVLGLAVLAFLLIGCDREEIDPSPVDLQMEMFEILGPEASQLQLYFVTEQEYECANYQIQLSVIDTLDQVAIDVAGVKSPSLCIETPTPATNFAVVRNRRAAINFSVSQGDIVSTGILDIQADRYVLTMDETNRFVSLRDELFKVPSGLYWGTVSLATANAADQYQGLLDQLENRGATLSPDLAAGDYGYFTIGTDGSMTIPRFEENLLNEVLFLSYPLDADTFQSILDDYPFATFSVSLTSYEGRSFGNSR